MRVGHEILCLHCGQAGIQVGNAIWQTLCGEHNIDPTGKLPHDYFIEGIEENALKTFFHGGPDSQNIPRSVMTDTEPTVIDEIKTGYFRKLFHPDNMLTGSEDAANNFARGYYNLGNIMTHRMVERCRFVVETCDNFQGFINYTGCGGGTGSGLFSRFLEQVSIEYSGRTMIGNVIVPGSSVSNCIVDPYNTILRMGNSNEFEDLNFVIDNQSLYTICKNMGIERPTYNSINKTLTPILTTFSAPLRFEGPLTGNLSEISTNLIPYPKINFPMLSYAPFTSKETNMHSKLDTTELTLNLMDPANNLLSSDLSRGYFMTSVMMYRGNHSVAGILEAIRLMKSIKKFQWVNWVPTGFKLVHTTFPALHSFSSNDDQPTRSILMMSNNTVIANHLNKELTKFHQLMTKKSYIFWYLGEGMEEMEFEQAFDEVFRIRNDYRSFMAPEIIVEDPNTTTVDPKSRLKMPNNYIEQEVETADADAKAKNKNADKPVLTESYSKQSYNDDGHPQSSYSAV